MTNPKTLAELRKAKGLTQAQLAQQAGISWSQLQRLEYGRGRPTWQTLQGLASVLGDEVYQVAFATDKSGRPGRKPKQADEQAEETQQ